MRRIVPLFFLLPLTSCGGGATAVELGPPRRLPRDERPTVWGAATRDRLVVADMRAPTSSGSTGQGPMAQGAQGPERQFTATTPDGWEVLPPQPAKFRNLLWRVANTTDTECYLSVGVGGGVAGNMARWYRQFGRADVPAAESLEVIEMAGRTGRLIDYAGEFGGKTDQGVLLAFFAEGDRVTSLKFTGPAATVKADRAKFLALAKSLRSASASPNPNAPPIDPGATMPDGHPPVGGPVGSGPVGSGQGPLAPPAEGEKFIADVPNGWESLPAQPARFREAIWRVAGDDSTECYLSAGVGGGVTGNLTRWYRQFGQSDVPAVEALPAAQLGGRDGHLVELDGTFGGKPDMAMLLAFFADDDAVTSLKFTGPKATVQKQKDAFLQIARTLRAAPAGGAPRQAPTPTAPTQPMPGMPQAGTSPFTATVPNGWTPKAGSSKPLHHTFGSDGEVYVSQLGGTPRQMLDIWRGELGLQPLTDAEFGALPKTQMLGGEGVLLDMRGHYRGMTGKEIADAGMLIAVVENTGSTVFCKLVASASDCVAQRKAFESFCGSLRRLP